VVVFTSYSQSLSQLCLPVFVAFTCLSYLIQSASGMAQPTTKAVSPEKFLGILCEIKGGGDQEASQRCNTRHLYYPIFKYIGR